MREHSHVLTDQAYDQLRKVVRSLGRGGGAITPSIYETAQVLRFCPELVEVDKVVGWLLDCQQPDGGWGEVEAPLYRVVPTLAAILALQSSSTCARVRQACTAGQQFLEEQEKPIERGDGEYLPVAIELILPRLLDELGDVGMPLSRARFEHIEELGTRRRQLISKHPQRYNSPPAFSWEAWGTDPAADLVGSVGGVGHSPAATAWWLRLDEGRTSASAARNRARNYIGDASCAAGCRIRGVVPAPWPMNRFEQSFVLHIIEMAGLLRCCQLEREISAQLEELRVVLGAGALGFSDYFAPDGDDTSAALAVLAAADISVDCDVLSPFERSQHFVAYPFEMHISYAVTARATQALSLVGRNVESWRNSIVQAQQPDGWWPSEKWNRSRLYGTTLALAALDGNADRNKAAAAQAFLGYQNDDGGWGCFGHSTPVETAFAVLALHNMGGNVALAVDCEEAVSSAHCYLRKTYNVDSVAIHRMWIGKDLYSAKRVDHATVLCALIASSIRSRVFARTEVVPL